MENAKYKADEKEKEKEFVIRNGIGGIKRKIKKKMRKKQKINKKKKKKFKLTQSKKKQKINKKKIKKKNKN